MNALDSPLLNDNKIEGAKNVLLLIVSGSDEITIDEIGEINDYIQAEAKTSVNIIMGVGEDDSLGDAIAVTVVATGFHKDQQSDIIQQEPKKVIHILDENQKSTFDLTDSSEFVSRSEDVVRHTLEDPNERIVHTLDEEDIEEMELIPTSQIIKNMDVVYEEISYDTSEDFIITSAVNEIEVFDHEEIKVKEENQTTFVFDNPIDIHKETEDLTVEVANNINDIEVVNPTEVIPLAEEEDAIVFDLGDFNEPGTKHIEPSKPLVAETKVEVEEELQFVVKQKAIEEVGELQEADQELSPMHLTISELKNRAEERKNKMNKFNYKFNNKLKSNNIDEIEKEPAYKRMGVELDDALLSSDSNQSKTSLSVDENNDLQFRSNNSFLHDNVD